MLDTGFGAAAYAVPAACFLYLLALSMRGRGAA
jgi:hypothetical protein